MKHFHQKNRSPGSFVENSEHKSFFRPAIVQKKMEINQPNDRFEREADAVADQVMSMPMQGGNSKKDFFSFNPIPIQRKCAACEKEDEELYRKEKSDANPQPSNNLEEFIPTLDGKGKPMSSKERAFFEPRFNQNFSSVRLHTEPKAARTAQEINAVAYTSGNHIIFSQGEYQPETGNGRRLMAHELTHVLQQGGRQGTIQRSFRRVSPNVVEVEHEGERYRVTRRLTPGRRRGSTSSSIEPDINQTNITITIKVCRDSTRGQLELGANIPERARGVAVKILDAVTRGDTSRISEELRGMDVTPFLEVILSRSGQFRLTARGEVTVGVEGVTGGAGSLGIRIGPFDFGIRGESNQQGGQIAGQFRWTPGQEDETFDCTSVPLTVSLECQKWHEASQYSITTQVPYHNRLTRFIYFDFANANIDHTRSAEMLADIRSLLQQGYRVTEITGHTSPEGPMQQGRRFEGNVQLAQSRADAALNEIESICATSLLNMRNPSNCVEGAVQDIQPIGMSELFTLIDEQGSEVEGDSLSQHAINEFSSAESETPHRSEELLEELEGMSLEQQRDRIYPLLRRATVILEKSGTRQEQVNLEDPAGFRIVGCPREVEQQARVNFMIN